MFRQHIPYRKPLYTKALTNVEVYVCIKNPLSIQINAKHPGLIQVGVPQGTSNPKGIRISSKVYLYATFSKSSTE